MLLHRKNDTKLVMSMRIDGALMGRGLHCEFGFEPVNLNTGNFYMDQSDATMNELNTKE